MVWDNDKKRYLERGDYTNMSKYVRVELTEAVKNGSQNPLSLPFGFFGPVRLEDNVYAANVVSTGKTIAEGTDVPSTDVLSTAVDMNTNSGGLTSARMVFPKIALRGIPRKVDLQILHLVTSVWTPLRKTTTSLKRVFSIYSVQTLLLITLTCREQVSIIISTFSLSTIFSITLVLAV